MGAPPLVQVGARESGGGCPIQQLVNSALLEGAREAQRLLEQRLRATTLDKLGADFARHLAHHRPWKVTMNPDVLIVGGSYAGIAAGLILACARRPVTVIDAGLPRIVSPAIRTGCWGWMASAVPSC